MTVVRKGVAAVIPCYNGAAFLAEALQSIENQKAVEHIIVVDDGSTDNSADIAKRYGAQVVRTSGRTGPSNARNLGVAATEFPLIAFLDADDAWLPDHVAKLVDVLESQSAALVGGTTVSWDGRPMAETHDGAPLLAKPVSFWELLHRNPFPQSAVVLRREVFLEVGGYRSTFRFAEDYDLWLRMSVRSARMISCESRSCKRRSHVDQASLSLGKMKLGAWNARMDVSSKRALGPSMGADTAFELALSAALHDDMVDAWYLGDREARDVLSRFAQQSAFLQTPWNRSAAELGPWWIAVVKSRIRSMLG